VQITAPKHVLLTAAGAAIEIKGGNITLKGPGKVEFKASMKELKGPGSASQSLELKKPGELKGCAERVSSAARKGAAVV
jgi:type VI secretion system secreted protein VgrG